MEMVGEVQRHQVALYRQCLRRTSAADVIASYARQLAAAGLSELNRNQR